MKLRTSFFNIRVLLKNLTRFAPVWVLYTVAQIIGLLSLNLEPGFAADDLTHIMGPVAIFHAIYALLVAACLFGDLFDSRMCNGLHAMPMRREGWLLTNLASGLVFALIPALAAGVVAAVLLEEYYWIGLLWQGASLLQFVFFFGIAVFSAMCAGKRLGMIAIYGILNFLSMLIFWVADMIYEPLLPGVVLSDDWFVKFCPVISMLRHTYLNFYYDWNLGGFFEGFYPDNWNYLYLCAGIGVAFTALGWLLYRKRHLETAGDFISFRPMRMFFLVAYTIAVGAVLYSFGDLLGLYKDYGFLTVGLLIGWFTGWMLLERTVKVFSKKVFLGLAAFAVLFAGSVGITVLDPFGVVTRVPQTEEIANVCLYQLSDTYAYHSTAGEEGWYITDPAEIAQVQELHERMLNTPVGPDAEILNMELRYQLKNGFYVYRSYDVPVESAVAEDLRWFLSDPRAVFAVDDWQQVQNSADYVRIYFSDDGMNLVEISDLQQIQALLRAIEADCAAGNFAQHDYLHPDEAYIAGMDIVWRTVKTTTRGSIARGSYVTVYADCVNTRAFLETLAEKE